MQKLIFISNLKTLLELLSSVCTQDDVFSFQTIKTPIYQLKMINIHSSEVSIIIETQDTDLMADLNKMQPETKFIPLYNDIFTSIIKN